MNILQLLVETELLFTLVEYPGVRKFMNKVDPKVTVKSANTFAQQKLPLMTRTIRYHESSSGKRYSTVHCNSNYIRSLDITYWSQLHFNNIALCETRLHIEKLHNPVVTI